MPEERTRTEAGSSSDEQEAGRLLELLTTAQHAQVNGGLIGNPKRPHVHDEKILDQVRIERRIIHFEATVPERGE